MSSNNTRVDWGNTIKRIIEVLQEQGPMTRVEIAQALGVDRMRVSAIITRMRAPTKTLPKRVYVLTYVYEADGARYYPRAVYALGDRPDTRKPKPNRKEVRRRYDERVRLRMTGNSVFNWGQPRREYLKRQRALAKTQEASK